MIDEIFRETNGGLELLVHLTPGAKNEGFTSILRDDDGVTIKIAVHTKPTDNQANDALIKLISSKFKVAKSRITIKRGVKSRVKLVFISGFATTDVPADTVTNLRQLLVSSSIQHRLF